MWNLKKKKQKKALLDALIKIKESDNFEEEGLSLLAGAIRAVRPNGHLNIRIAKHQLHYLTQYLRKDAVALKKFQDLLKYLFPQSDISEVLTESGLIVESGFFTELGRRIKNKILPPLRTKGSFLYAIDAIFYKKSDYKWVNSLDNSLWVEFFEILGIDINISSSELQKQLVKSLYILSYRIAALGMEKTIAERSGKNAGVDSFFMQQNQFLNDNRSILNTDDKKLRTKFKNEYYEILDKCDETLKLLRRKTILQGIGIRQTYVMLQLQQLIERLRLGIDFWDNDGAINLDRFAWLFMIVVENENTKTSIRRCIGKNVEFLAYQVAENERNTGEHYITTTKKEYIKMFKSAAGGGAIVALMAPIKIGLHSLKMAPFWQSFCDSLNYSFGFVGIQLLGFTLATKQPAMTASTLASSLEGKKFGGPNLPQLAITISKVFRSQTASFAGNLIIVFPMALLFALLWLVLFDKQMVSPEKAQVLLNQINPAKGICYIYAAIAGVFLFLSGLISGYVDNVVRYGKVPQRIKEHPTLHTSLSKQLIEKIASFVEKKMGLLVGNFAFGFFLGMTPLFQVIFGLPLDIRHITFSTANFAIGLLGLQFQIPISELIWILAGICIIGVMNFAVSFLLAFWVALRSRGVKIRQYNKLFHYIKVLLFKYPLDFIRPPKKERQIEDIADKKIAIN